MKQDLKSILTGLERMRDINVELDSHHYIVLSILNSWVMNVAAPASSGSLLDFGCGGQPYRRIFEPYISRYIGADVASASGVTLDLELIPDARVPLDDASMDTILSTQVLEHVFDFRTYLGECARLLKPRGRLIISVPMHWRHHEEPFDYWRFTKFGLKKTLEQAGFSILDLRPCGGVFAMLGQVFLDHRSACGKNQKIVTKFVNRIALWLDRKIPDTDDTLGWMCIGEKRSMGDSDDHVAK